MKHAHLALYTELTDTDVDMLDALRKSYARRRENILQVQKRAAAAKCYEAAKSCKPVAAELMQYQRACELWDGQLVGKFPHRRPEHWPQELAVPIQRVGWVIMDPDIMMPGMMEESYEEQQLSAAFPAQG